MLHCRRAFSVLSCRFERARREYAVILPTTMKQPMRHLESPEGGCTQMACTGRVILVDRRSNTVRRLAGNVATLLDIARREWDTNQDAALASIAKACCLLRGEIDRPSACARQNAIRNGLLGWQVRRVRDYIEAHMGAQIRVSDLSALVRRSEAHFARAFKRSFGKTPHSYLVERRVEQASHLMLASDSSISDIAAACGFNDQAHFCNQFRRRHGQTPAAWRRETCACRE